MTQVQPTSPSTTTLDHLVRLANDRSARGNATRRDWERVAEIDPDRAYRELRDFIRRTGHAEVSTANPYESRSRVPGALIGFIAGVVLMIVVWIVLPYAREHWMDFGVWRDIATGAQFISTLLIPLGALLGARWSRRHNDDAATTQAAPASLRNASFDELLAIFERTQNVGRARVY
jgi:hypothetical protein